MEYLGEIMSCATALWGEDTSYVLLGHSMGAALAFQCTAVDPRVSHLISIDAFGRHSTHRLLAIANSCSQLA